ncbi:DNA helicase UvrD [Candidatus Woesearchaeota archaeon]|nr:DNA helicase UvrD [Candidatus Woesearchaeota archaeon]
MKLFADLHVHSRFAQGTSDQLDLANLEKWGRVKGLGLVGTGDFTHPKWIAELKANLTQDDTGLPKTKSGFPFCLQTEISLVYTQDGKGRRIHQVVLAPSFEVVDQITEYLLTKGRVDYDGRPIFKIPSPEFVERLRGISKDIEVIPAHIWTPWFGMLGSKSGFDTVQDCFKDQTRHIHAIETGLSSDPKMNWRLSQLDPYRIVSFSDLHSFWPWRIGREATVFDIAPTYKDLIKAIRTGDGLSGTIEFWPEEGKYHYDGHRACGVCMAPSDSMKARKICPKCGREMTIGVAYRVEELADREEGFRHAGARPYHNLIPLSELIAGATGQAVTTKRVWAFYNDLIKAFRNEFAVLLDASQEELAKATDPKLAGLIIRNREQKIPFKPGYDGVYGEPVFDSSLKVEETLTQPKHVQKGLEEFW